MPQPSIPSAIANEYRTALVSSHHPSHAPPLTRPTHLVQLFHERYQIPGKSAHLTRRSYSAHPPPYLALHRSSSLRTRCTSSTVMKMA
jgi:hypothetical protein